MTLEQLNTPLRVRVRQLELALERWRRRPYDPSRPAIVLNLPEFRLRAFGGTKAAGHDPELEMKVVVGQALDHETAVCLLNSRSSPFVRTGPCRPVFNATSCCPRSCEIHRGSPQTTSSWLLGWVKWRWIERFRSRRYRNWRRANFCYAKNQARRTLWGW
jgi:hypothetical protein